MPQALAGAEQSTVLLTLDGLGWNQLQPRRALAPTLTSAMQGGPVCTVAPSTTSTALTSIVTGMPPGEHYVADMTGFRDLLAYLMEDCCNGSPELCRPVINALTCDCQELSHA